MKLVEITLQLPEELVRDAQEFNILTSEQVAELVQAEVDRRVLELVNAEIHAYRAEKAGRQSG
ncbi:MAG: hypothetical protein IT319_15340, partial [Anaerolineae bacterium]|nr:hypothetical protein [Anaerolineae bacterium]